MTNRRKWIVCAGVLTLFVVFAYVRVVVPMLREIHERRLYFACVQQVTSRIESFKARRPDDVPKEQWEAGIDWTRNVIIQDFFWPTPPEVIGIEKLARELEQKSAGQVDLVTLQWIWDQCEIYCGGPRSCSIKFRDVKLLTNGAITDDSLPVVWSLDHCTGLDLSDTEITDHSIPFLAELEHLERLDLNRTGVTEHGIHQLQSARPDLEVFWIARGVQAPIRQEAQIQESHFQHSTDAAK